MDPFPCAPAHRRTLEQGGNRNMTRITGTHGLRALMAGAAFAVSVGAMAQADSITVYTSYEEDELTAFLESMKTDLPDLTVNVLRLSTGDLMARMICGIGQSPA
jgi:hypothetical protein